VFDRDYSDKPVDERNGYCFKDADAKALESALSRAVDQWYNASESFRALMFNGMRQDYSWDLSGNKYLEIYEKIRSVANTEDRPTLREPQDAAG
jgi:starch synthase